MTFSVESLRAKCGTFSESSQIGQVPACRFEVQGSGTKVHVRCIKQES